MVNLNFVDLKNKVCVITGGTGVIGSALAEGLASIGVKVAIVGRNKEKASKTVAQIQSNTGTLTRGYEADVLNRNLLEKAKKDIINEIGSVSFLINGAGGNATNATTPIEKLEPENLDNLDQSFFGLDAFIYLQSCHRTVDI